VALAPSVPSEPVGPKMVKGRREPVDCYRITVETESDS
jgi:hypothetical protein